MSHWSQLDFVLITEYRNTEKIQNTEEKLILSYIKKETGSPCRGPSLLMVSDRLGVKRHTACWNVGEICSMSDWQYSMTLAQIYEGRITVTKILVPQMPKYHRTPDLEENKVTDHFVKFQQSSKSICRITPIYPSVILLLKTHKCSRPDTRRPPYFLTCCMASSSSSFLLTRSPSTLSSWNLNWHSLSDPPKRLRSPKHWRWERERDFIRI